MAAAKKKNIKSWKNNSCFLVSCLVTISHAQIEGKMFPNMIAETVEDKQVNLPNDTKGKYTLLGLAYSKIGRWIELVVPAHLWNVHSKTTGLMGSMGYDVNVYFICPCSRALTQQPPGTAKKKAMKMLIPNFALRAVL